MGALPGLLRNFGRRPGRPFPVFGQVEADTAADISVRSPRGTLNVTPLARQVRPACIIVCVGVAIARCAF